MQQTIVPEIMPLWKHQREGMLRALEAGNFALFFEMGAGKTLTTITALRNLCHWYQKPLKTLVLCPSIVVANWVREIGEFSKFGPQTVALVGSGENRRKILYSSNANIFVTNYEALDMEDLFWQYKGKRRVAIDHKWEVIICDESHRLKNNTAKRTKIAHSVRDLPTVKHCFILSGSPVLNKPEDIWSQFRMMDGGQVFGRHFLDFRNTYFWNENANKPAHVTWPSWRPKPGTIETLRNMIAPFSMVVKKQECMDLPPFIEVKRFVEMSAEQAAAYKQMEKDYVTYVRGEEATATIALVKFLRLQQILAGFVTTDNGQVTHFRGTNPRIAAITDLLEDLDGQKVIIWSPWTATYELIEQVCEKMAIPYVSLTGRETQKEKEVNEKEFRFGNAMVCIGNPSAAGTGVNLTEASTAIWFARTFKLGDRLQAQARNYRGGSDKLHTKVTQIDLVCPNSFDEKILTALANKQDIASQLLKWSKGIA